MMPEPKKNESEEDAELRRQLRAVSVPSDLQAKLLAISGGQSDGSDSDEKPVVNLPRAEFVQRAASATSLKPLTWSLGLATVVMVSSIGLFYLTNQTSHREISVATDSDSSAQFALNTAGSGSTHDPEAATQSNSAEIAGEHETNVWLADQNARLAELEAEVYSMVLELQLESLEQRRREFQSAQLAGVSRREALALALAVSGETMQAWAGQTPVVKDQLNQVVQLFPETQGGELAARILAN